MAKNTKAIHRIVIMLWQWKVWNLSKFRKLQRIVHYIFRRRASKKEVTNPSIWPKCVWVDCFLLRWEGMGIKTYFGHNIIMVTSIKIYCQTLPYIHRLSPCISYSAKSLNKLKSYLFNFIWYICKPVAVPLYFHILLVEGNWGFVDSANNILSW